MSQNGEERSEKNVIKGEYYYNISKQEVLVRINIFHGADNKVRYRFKYELKFDI